MTAPAFEFRYREDVVDADWLAGLAERLRQLDYEHQAYGGRARAAGYQGPGQRMERGYVQLGHAYDCDGAKRAGAPAVPDYLERLCDRARQALLVPETVFNQAVVMHYPLASGVGWHTDGARFGACIIGVSLGAPAWLRFRPRGEELASHEFLLRPGSAYLLHGAARWDYQHMIAPVEGERWSVTFRTIAN